MRLTSVLFLASTEMLPILLAWSYLIWYTSVVLSSSPGLQSQSGREAFTHISYYCTEKREPGMFKKYHWFCNPRVSSSGDLFSLWDISIFLTINHITGSNMCLMTISMKCCIGKCWNYISETKLQFLRKMRCVCMQVLRGWTAFSSHAGVICNPLKFK